MGKLQLNKLAGGNLKNPLFAAIIIVSLLVVFNGKPKLRAEETSPQSSPAIAPSEPILISVVPENTTTRPNEPRPPNIAVITRILKPLNGQTLGTNSLTLKVSVDSNYWLITSVYCRADWLEGDHQIYKSNISYPVNITVTTLFLEIPDGNHSLTIYGNTLVRTGEASVFFYISANSPRILNSYVYNGTYYSTDVNLKITFDKPTSWIGYSLDGHQIITISNRETPCLGNSVVNASLKGLSIGSHSITFYANDTFGHMGSETIDFSVAKPSISEKPSVENLSSVAIAVISVTVAMVCLIVGLFLFRRHRKTLTSRNLAMAKRLKL